MWRMAERGWGGRFKREREGGGGGEWEIFRTYQCSNCDAGCDGGYGASADVACEAAAGC